MSDAKEILRRNSFRVTRHRHDVLSYFMQSKVALGHSHLEKKYKGIIDRVSLYRILNSFTEKRILCRLIDSFGAATYVFDRHSSQVDAHIHPHYKCRSCNDVVELPELPNSYLKELEKLNIQELNILAEGICEDCQKLGSND